MAELPPFDEIAENLELFDGWEDRYRYIIELGRDMGDLPEARRTDAVKVEGCASQVWLVPELVDTADGQVLRFEGDSDAMIVRGLIAVLVTLASGRTVAEIRAMDIRAELGKLQLEQALSAQRSNGLRAMVDRINDIARAAKAA
ncbi:MAG: SufE family protein [Pseudomonadota bacterium]